MSENHEGLSRSANARARAWIRAEITSSGDLVVADHSSSVPELLGWEGKNLAGANLADILSGLTLKAAGRRVNEVARNGGEAVYPRCRYSAASVERWFSLECHSAEPRGVFLSFGRAGGSAPCTNEAGMVLDRFPWCMQAYDLSGLVTEINAAFEQTSGLSCKDLKDYNILYDPAYRREDLAGLVDRVYQGELVRFDALAGPGAAHPLRLFESAFRPLFPVLGFPEIDDQGNVHGIIMAYAEVYAEKSPTDHLVGERQFAAEVIETVAALIICLDTSGRITLFNPKCEETSGWKKEEVLDAKIWDVLIPPRWVDRIQKVFEELDERSVGLAHYQNPWLTKDGRERVISWHMTYHHGPSGKIKRITAMGVDITDQIRVEQQLRESEERYRSVTEYSLTGIFIYQDNRFIYCNARLEEIIGLHRDMIIGRDVWEFSHPDDREMIRDRATRRQRGEANLPTHYSFRIINSSGDTRWLDMNVTEMEYLRRPAFLGNVVDITEQKEAESELDELRRRLAQTQKMEALATLIGGIAHDFNNLLTGIMAGTSDVLAQTEPDDMRFKPLGDILQTSRRAKDLISQLLTAGSHGTSAMAELDINEVIQEVVRFVRPTLGENTELRLMLSDEPVLVLGDRSQLWQTFSNLCLNARDAMPDGGILEIKTEAWVIEPGEKDKVSISISDTGKGIPAEIKDRIFEPFFTTKERGLGIGLGLAVVYGAVKNHDGRIDVLDRPGGGTIFRILVEKVPSTAASERVVGPLEKDQKTKQTILIVDDEDGVRHVVGRILSREGHLVQTAKDLDETMNKISECNDKIDLVILDLEMPGTSGAEIFAEIKRTRPEMKILLSSGQVPGSVAKRLLAEGAAGFLQKPYDLWELRRAVKKAIAPNA